jgi:hypothetical protein
MQLLYRNGTGDSNQAARSDPAASPAHRASDCSRKSCRTSRGRLAPSAIRTPTSRVRLTVVIATRPSRPRRQSPGWRPQRIRRAMIVVGGDGGCLRRVLDVAVGYAPQDPDPGRGRAARRQGHHRPPDRQTGATFKKAPKAKGKTETAGRLGSSRNRQLSRRRPRARSQEGRTERITGPSAVPRWPCP